MQDLQQEFDDFAAIACPGRLRDDFLQELWVGALGHGTDKPGVLAAAKRRAKTWLQRERRHEKRQPASGLLLENESASG